MRKSRSVETREVSCTTYVDQCLNRNIVSNICGPIVIYLLLFTHWEVNGQSLNDADQKDISYDTIPVGYTTSVNLIFDSSVKQWDMGLGLRDEDGKQVWDVLVGNSAESPNRIKLAAGIKEFHTTNLFVETANGYYNFILKYEDLPRKLLYQIDTEMAEIVKADRNHTFAKAMVGRQKSENNSEISKRNPSVSPSQGRVSKDKDLHQRNGFGGQTNVQHVGNDSLEYLSRLVLESGGSFNPIGKSSQQIHFFLSGIYIRGDYLFFKLYIRNDSSIPFDIGFIGFFKSDRGRTGSKKRPKEEEQLTPEYVLNVDIKTLESNSEIFQIATFKRFTLSKRKRLYIQLWEGNRGERKIELVARGKDLLRAAPLARNVEPLRGEE